MLINNKKREGVVPIIIVLTVAVQAYFIFHVIRTGRPYWWGFIILSFPIAGSIIYYFVEIFPSSREHRSARKAVNQIVRTLKPDAELARRVQEVELCGSVDNKLSLAEECERSGMHEEAIRLYRSCLNGVYANDPKILFALAEALLAHEQFGDARGKANRLLQEHPQFRPNETKLLLARALEGAGDAQATRVYEEVVAVFRGFEAKYRYALHLKSLGHTRQAHGLLEEIVEHARRFNINHDEEIEWVRSARRALAT